MFTKSALFMLAMMAATSTFAADAIAQVIAKSAEPVQPVQQVAPAPQAVVAPSTTTVVLAPTVPAAQPLPLEPKPELVPHSRKSLLIESGATYASASVGSQYYDGNCCRTGFLIGARVEWETSENVSFIPGVRYIQKGGRARTGGPDLMVALNYIEIPLQVKYRFSRGPVRPYVFGGPNIAFLTSAQANSFNVPVADLRYSTSATDFSLEVGLGVDVALDERWSLFFANSYSFGLNDIDNSLDSWRSRTLMLTGGVKIGF